VITGRQSCDAVPKSTGLRKSAMPASDSFAPLAQKLYPCPEHGLGLGLRLGLRKGFGFVLSTLLLYAVTEFMPLNHSHVIFV